MTGCHGPRCTASGPGLPGNLKPERLQAAGARPQRNTGFVHFLLAARSGRVLPKPENDDHDHLRLPAGPGRQAPACIQRLATVTRSSRVGPSESLTKRRPVLTNANTLASNNLFQLRFSCRNPKFLRLLGNFVSTCWKFGGKPILRTFYTRK